MAAAWLGCLIVSSQGVVINESLSCTVCPRAETYKDVNSFLYAGKIMLLHDAAVNCS